MSNDKKYQFGSIIFTMFEKAWRITSTTNNSLMTEIKRVRQLQEELKNDRSAKSSQYVQAILKEVLGSGNGGGILVELSKQVHRYKVVEWLTLVEEVLGMIGPQSLVMKKIITNPEAKMTINVGLLPQSFNLKKHNQEKRIIEIKQAYQGYSVSLIDGYFLMLVNGILNHTWGGVEYTQHQKLLLDDFFGRICKNPFLMLLRRLFIFFANSRMEVRKLAEVIRMFFIEEIIIKYEGDHRMRVGYRDGPMQYSSNAPKMYSFGDGMSRRSSPLTYKLRENHLLCLYLLLKYASQCCSDFKKYILGVCQNYSTLVNDRKCLHTFVRVWMFWIGVQNYHHIENKVIDALENSNCHDGWFELQRYSLDQVTKQSTNNLDTVEQVLRLFERDGNWEVNCAYVYTIAMMFKFLTIAEFYSGSSIDSSNKQLLISDLNQQTRQQSCLLKIMENVNRKLVEIVWQFKQKIKKQGEFKRCFDVLYDYLRVIQDYYGEFSQRKKQNKTHKFSSVNINDKSFTFKEVTDADLARNQIIEEVIPGSVEKNNKTNLVSFYRRQPKSTWEIPIQYHESTLLFYFFYTIARGVDLVIPGRRKEPLLNLRFLASPLNFFIFLFLIIIVYTLFI